MPDVVRQGVDVDADLVAGLGLLGLLASLLYFFVQAGGSLARRSSSSRFAWRYERAAADRAGAFRTVRYRRAAARTTVGAVGRFPSSTAETMRRYCHAPAAPPSSRSAMTSAASPSSTSRYTSPIRDESAAGYAWSSFLTSSLGWTDPAAGFPSAKDDTSVAPTS